MGDWGWQQLRRQREYDRECDAKASRMKIDAEAMHTHEYETALELLRKGKEDVDRPARVGSSCLDLDSSVKDMLDDIPPTFKTTLRLKYRELAGTKALSTVWARVYTPTALTQGLSVYNRRGISAFIHAIQIRFYIQRASSEAQTAPAVDLTWRVVLVIDKQPRGAYPDVPIFLRDKATSFVHMNYIRRYQILKDISGVLKPNFLNEGSPNKFAEGRSQTPIFTFNVPFKPTLAVRYTGTSEGPQHFGTNAMHLYIIVEGVAYGTLFYDSRIIFE